MQAARPVAKSPRNKQEIFRLLGKGDECPSKLLINVFSSHNYFMTCLENEIGIINWTVSCYMINDII